MRLLFTPSLRSIVRFKGLSGRASPLFKKGDTSKWKMSTHYDELNRLLELDEHRDPEKKLS